MNQERIGKFIQESRKKKGLTQLELAEALGVTDRAVSNWENGKNMPDLSLFKPLCEILDITINDLLSGEVIKDNEYQEKLEENIINTIDYSNKKVSEKNNLIGTILLVFGILLTLTAMSIFPSESSWGSIYSVIGCIISLIGVAKFTKKLSYPKRLLCHFGYFVIYLAILFVIDYIGVIYINQAPRFSYIKDTGSEINIYKTPFYNVYRINRNTPNEYYIVDTKGKYTEENIPISPFNRSISGIDNIIKYKNKYVGNNSNDSGLINSLPLREYSHVLEIDSTNLGLTIDYHITDWYITNNTYLKQSLIYNTIAIFILVDNVEYINFNFTGNTYYVTREKVKNNYPHYDEIISEGINKDKFNKYVENMIRDNAFVEETFTKLFNK